MPLVSIRLPDDLEARLAREAERLTDRSPSSLETEIEALALSEGARDRKVSYGAKRKPRSRR